MGISRRCLCVIGVGVHTIAGVIRSDWEGDKEQHNEDERANERTKGKEVLGTGDVPLPAVHGRKKVNKAGFALMSAFVVVFMYLLRACPQSV